MYGRTSQPGTVGGHGYRRYMDRRQRQMVRPGRRGRMDAGDDVRQFQGAIKRDVTIPNSRGWWNHRS